MGGLLLCSFIGCGKKLPTATLHPVEGVFRWHGVAAEKATVILHPSGNPQPKDWPGGYPRGVVDASGTFRISTFKPGDGAPAGEYVILLRWLERPDEEDEHAESPNLDLLENKFSDPQKSTLKVTVSTGKNLLSPVELP